MADIEKLRELLARVGSADRPDLMLDHAIWDILGDDLHGAPLLTSSIEAAVALCERALPGWWWKVGTCCVSDDACVAPDYNSPEHGERLKREFPLPTQRYQRPGTSGASPTTWGPYDEGFDIDRRPPGNVALALCQAILEAKLYIAEQAILEKEPA